ncbi:hypothetical protein Q8A67_009657 [Cirrhinus molitorella]|uniref:Fibronectin type-II domain-containing protein n=1 Tax=Cirrhinus molitorella TaxID=172907 RepID=A0AA88PVM5_9TELE|nr:hypothetical protein Q8A67_009657 [Cirrhinus molitorella]
MEQVFGVTGKFMGPKKICVLDIKRYTGGSSLGKPCHFPFKFDGKWYTDCTVDGRKDAKKLWCSTEKDYDMERKWGFCPPKNVPVPNITMFRQMEDRECVIVVCSFGKRLFESTFHLFLEGEHNYTLNNPMCYSSEKCVFEVKRSSKAPPPLLCSLSLSLCVSLRLDLSVSVLVFGGSVSFHCRGSFILSSRMSGLLTSSLLLFLSLTLFQIPTPEAKPLSAMRGGGRSFDSQAGGVRLRRDLRDSVPYEAQMMSYPAADFRSRSNDLYYQPEVLRAQGLGQALQRLVESDQKREQEAAYLASMLRLLNEAQNNGQGKPEEEEEEADFQGPYPPDYDETEQAVSMAKPQASWQGLLDPQLTQALLNRYKQERLMQAGLAPNTNRIPEREQDKDQEMLRYLVEKILSSLASGGSQGGPSSQRSKRDLSAVANMEQSGGAALKRSRRSLDSAPGPSPQLEASLLRVKRLDGDVEDDGVAGQNNRTPHVGLQRMKRIDTDLPPPKKHSRKRRALTYDPALIAQHILQYLPA